MKLFVIVILAGAVAVAQTPPATKGRASHDPVFSDLPLPAAAPAATSSPVATSPVLIPPSIFPGTTNAAPVPGGYVADDKYKLRAGDKISLHIIEDRDPLPK